MIIIGEKINGAIPAVKEAIAARDADAIIARALAQAEAGADFILMETQIDIGECRAAALAARETGLPVAASFTYNPNGRTLTGRGTGAALTNAGHIPSKRTITHERI